MFKVKPVNDHCLLPLKEYEGDAGFDVFNNGQGEYIEPGCRIRVNLGFALELELGYVALIQEKSGMAFNQGIITIGNTIDSNYRGEVHAILVNLSDELVTIRPKQKVAQMLVLPCYTGKKYTAIDTLSESNRGANGFGSTGL